MSEDTRSQVYLHLKSRRLYVVLEWDAIIERSVTKAVVYRSLQDGQVWIRPYEEFTDGRFRCVTPTGCRGVGGVR
jgi:hypothetical protein